MITPAIAGGNIAPSRFCTPSTAADNTALQSSVNTQKIMGVSQRGTRNTPYSTLDDGFCAIAGESFQLYGEGETCMIEAGAAVTAGDRLMSDGSGKGITATSGKEFGAIATQAATASGKLIEVFITFGVLP